MEIYHYNWLKKHPERDEQWLKSMLLMGFDIHHMDGDHNNNEPDNLILIEHLDHMRTIHNNKKFNRIQPGFKKGQSKRKRGPNKNLRKTDSYQLAVDHYNSICGSI